MSVTCWKECSILYDAIFNSCLDKRRKRNTFGDPDEMLRHSAAESAIQELHDIGLSLKEPFRAFVALKMVQNKRLSSENEAEYYSALAIVSEKCERRVTRNMLKGATVLVTVMSKQEYGVLLDYLTCDMVAKRMCRYRVDSFYYNTDSIKIAHDSGTLYTVSLSNVGWVGYVILLKATDTFDRNTAECNNHIIIFEIFSTWRGLGIGRRTVEHLESLYGILCCSPTKSAEGFWKKTNCRTVH